MAALKLNISACSFIAGWVNMAQHAVLSGHPDVFVWDARKGLPYGDGTVMLIRVVGFLEYLNIAEALDFLRECHRVLQAGGVLRVIVPDLGLILTKWLRNEMDDFLYCQPPIYLTLGADNRLACLLFNALPKHAGQEGHKHAYTWDAIREALEIAGFKKVMRMETGRSTSRIMEKEAQDRPASHFLYVEATKEKEKLP